MPTNQEIPEGKPLRTSTESLRNPIENPVDLPKGRAAEKLVEITKEAIRQMEEAKKEAEKMGLSEEQLQKKLSRVWKDSWQEKWEAVERSRAEISPTTARMAQEIEENFKGSWQRGGEGFDKYIDKIEEGLGTRVVSSTQKTIEVLESFANAFPHLGEQFDQFGERYRGSFEKMQSITMETKRIGIKEMAELYKEISKGMKETGEYNEDVFDKFQEGARMIEREARKFGVRIPEIPAPEMAGRPRAERVDITAATRAIGAIPGMEDVAGVAGGMASMGTSVMNLVKTGTGFPALVIAVMQTIKEIDAFIDSLRKVRDSIAMAGLETWHIPLGTLKVSLDAAMRTMTRGAAGAESAFALVSTIKDLGLVEAFEHHGRTFIDVLEDIQEAGRQGGIEGRRRVADLTQELAGMVTEIRDFAIYLGTNAESVAKIFDMLARSGLEFHKVDETFMKQVTIMTLTARELNIPLSKYTQLVNEGMQTLRFYNFEVADVIALTKEFGEELRTGQMSMRDFTRAAEEMFGTKVTGMRVLAMQEFIRANEDQTTAAGRFANFLKELPFGEMIAAYTYIGELGERGAKVFSESLKLMGADMTNADRLLREFGGTLDEVKEEMGPSYLRAIRGMGERVGALALVTPSPIPTIDPNAPVMQNLYALRTLNATATGNKATLDAIDKRATETLEAYKQNWHDMRSILGTISGMWSNFKTLVVTGNTVRVKPEFWPRQSVPITTSDSGAISERGKPYSPF